MDAEASLETDPAPRMHLHYPKTKTQGAEWAVYTPIWLPEKRKWKNWRVFKTKGRAESYLKSISPQKGV